MIDIDENKKVRFYYVNRVEKIVYVMRDEMTLSEGTQLEFLGKSDNPKPYFAVGAFLKGEEGYKIVI